MRSMVKLTLTCLWTTRSLHEVLFSAPHGSNENRCPWESSFVGVTKFFILECLWTELTGIRAPFVAPNRMIKAGQRGFRPLY